MSDTLNERMPVEPVALAAFLDAMEGRLAAVARATLEGSLAERIAAVDEQWLRDARRDLDWLRGEVAAVHRSFDMAMNAASAELARLRGRLVGLLCYALRDDTYNVEMIPRDQWSDGLRKMVDAVENDLGMLAEEIFAGWAAMEEGNG